MFKYSVKKREMIKGGVLSLTLIVVLFTVFALMGTATSVKASSQLALMPGYAPEMDANGVMTGYTEDASVGTLIPNNSTGGSRGNTLNVPLTPSKTLSEASTFKDVLYIAISYIDKAVYVIISLSILSMVYGVYKHFIHNGDSPASRAEGGKYVLWGIFAIFVILSFWGLVSILVNTFGVPGK